MLYFTDIFLIKLSILLFYLRIFPGTLIRKLIYGTIFVNAICWVVFVLLALFECRPISYSWTKWDGEHEGTCIDNNALGWASAAITIAMDIWMLYLPMPELMNLKLHWKKKVSVGIMFGVGAL